MKGFEDRPHIHDLTWQFAGATAEPHDNWPGRRVHPHRSVEWFKSLDLDPSKALQEIQAEARDRGWEAEEYRGFIWLISPQEEAP